MSIKNSLRHEKFDIRTCNVSYFIFKRCFPVSSCTASSYFSLLTYMHRLKKKTKVPRAFAEWRFWRTTWIREISFYEKLAKPKTTKIGMSIDLHITIATRESAKRKHHKHLIEQSKTPTNSGMLWRKHFHSIRNRHQNRQQRNQKQNPFVNNFSKNFIEPKKQKLSR